MLLSRVAEAVYWAGRYVERAETTSRIVKVQTELYLDLPRSAGLGWSPLLAVTGSDERYDVDRHERSEEQVIAFLLSDHDNHGSVIASLAQARENMRTTRSVFPREVWEALNELYHWANDNRDDAVPRRSRLMWTEHVMAECQRLIGILAGTMTHDAAYSFMRIGRHVERADMTSRVLDVQAGTLLEQPDGQPYADLTWMAVLKSVAGYQMYRRSVQTGVQGPEVLRFLLQDTLFPRAVQHCLVEIARDLLVLSHNDRIMGSCARAQLYVEQARVRSLAWDGLSPYVDGLQVHLGEVHDALSDTYFQVRPLSSPLARATA